MKSAEKGARIAIKESSGVNVRWAMKKALVRRIKVMAKTVEKAFSLFIKQLLSPKWNHRQRQKEKREKGERNKHTTQHDKTKIVNWIVSPIATLFFSSRAGSLHSDRHNNFARAHFFCGALITIEIKLWPKRERKTAIKNVISRRREISIWNVAADEQLNPTVLIFAARVSTFRM